MILLFSVLYTPYQQRLDLSIQFTHLKTATNLTSPFSVIWKSTLVLLILSYKENVALWGSSLILFLSQWVLPVSWTLPLDTNNYVNGRWVPLQLPPLDPYIQFGEIASEDHSCAQNWAKECCPLTNTVQEHSQGTSPLSRSCWEGSQCVNQTEQRQETSGSCQCGSASWWEQAELAFSHFKYHSLTLDVGRPDDWAEVLEQR